MKRKSALFFAVIGFGLLLTLSAAHWATINATECRIVRLAGEVHRSADLYVEPNVLRIQKGTCVIWLNWVRTEEVRIVFEDGKKCEDMTDSPIGFRLDSADCYVTTFVSSGETSSLMFNEPGTFEYVVKTVGPGGSVEERGQIVVRE